MTWWGKSLVVAAVLGLGACGSNGDGGDGDGDGDGDGASTVAGDEGQTDGGSGGAEGTTGGAAETTAAGAEGEDSPCFDSDECVSTLEILLPSGTDVFVLELTVGSDSGTVSCPDGATTDWLMTNPDEVTCSGASVTITIAGWKFPETVTISVDGAAAADYMPELEDNAGGCISACNQGSLQL